MAARRTAFLLKTVTIATCMVALSISAPMTAAAAATAQEADLVKANADWIAAINAGHYDRGLAIMSDDAAIVSAQGPVAIGRPEVSQNVQALTSMPGLHIEFALTRASVSNDGKLGVIIGDSAISRTTAEGQSVTRKQRLMTVWRRDEGGAWRCYLDVVF